MCCIAVHYDTLGLRLRLNSRLRLFDATISPTMLYGCVSWTTTKALTTKLLRTQRRMTRLIINTPRRRATPTTSTSSNAHYNDPQTEPWPDYIKRATATANKILSNLHMETWDTTYWRRKWRWASRIASQQHSRWSRQVCAWQPDLDDKRLACRPPGRPCKRWDDEIQQFLQTIQTPQPPASWLEAGQDNAAWVELENAFIKHLQNDGMLASSN